MQCGLLNRDADELKNSDQENGISTDEDNSDGDPYGDSLRGCTSDENDCTDINDGASSAEQEGLAWDGCF